MSGSREPRRRRIASLAERLIVAAIVFSWLLFLARGLALGWDEGYTFDRIELWKRWLAGEMPSGPTHSEKLSRPALGLYWRFSREEPDGHGPFYALLASLGLTLNGVFEPPLDYRIGPIAYFSFASAILYGTLATRWGRGAAIFAIALMATTPRLVPELCYALTDGPLVSSALLAYAGFLEGAEGKRSGRLLFGLGLGLAMCTKFTGWFLLAPYLAATILRPSRAALWTLLTGGFVAALITLTLNVGWWPDPVHGVEGYFRSNLTRSETRPIPILFWGKVYPFSLPWHNTLVWTVIAEPIGIVLLGLLGLLGAAGLIRHLGRDLAALAALLNWGIIMVLRAMPQTPGHDGARQLAVAFAFLPLLAAYGVHLLARSRFARGATFVAILAFIESVASALAYHPLELSYYSPAIGGLPGATKHGFEPTYFWDSLTPDVLAWLDANTPPEEKIFFRHNSPSFDYLTRWGRLKAGHTPTIPPSPTRWLVMQHRPGHYDEADRRLLETSTPAYQKTLFGVPVLSIFPFDAFKAAARETGMINRDPTREAAH